jgi:cell division protein FtsQ
MPAMKPPELVTDGTLDNAWLERTLQLPRGATLQGLDLLKLRGRLLADGQVLTANLTVHLPDRLEARITERTPIARVMVEAAGEQRAFVVARDGVIFGGLGYGDDIIQTLPWLDGVTITRMGETFRPIAGMDVASELLAKARLEAEHLYRTWHVVSLARLQADREIEVRTRAPHEVTIVFGASEDFFRQLARLDYTWEKLTSAAAVRARVDLSLGRDVLVTIEQASADASKPATGASAAAPEYSIFRSTVSQTKREL